MPGTQMEVMQSKPIRKSILEAHRQALLNVVEEFSMKLQTYKKQTRLLSFLVLYQWIITEPNLQAQTLTRWSLAWVRACVLNTGSLTYWATVSCRKVRHRTHPKLPYSWKLRSRGAPPWASQLFVTS